LNLPEQLWSKQKRYKKLVMNVRQYIQQALLFGCFILLMYACSPAEGDYPGRDYVPDMKHSIAYESNYYDYYSYNTWGSENEYHKFASPRKPVDRTIPRGYAGVAQNDQVINSDGQRRVDHERAPNGFVPYYYEDTEEERTRATQEITVNPFPISEEGLEKGKLLYDINCGICHGEEGNGLGYLVRDDGGVYPAQPANLISDEFIAASPGRFYHSIMYGKNVMGAYKDKLSYKERWDVIHYIRSLQADEKKLAYSAEENTLNNYGVPSVDMDSQPDSLSGAEDMNEVIGSIVD